MNEINASKRLAVGIFIVLGLVILIAAVFTIGGQHKAFVKSVRVHILFDDVQGLQPGNNVWLSGMKVGTVKSIDFYHNSQVAVTLNIEKKAQPHIAADARARISTDGLIGNKIVVISGGTDNGKVIADNDSLRSEHLAGTQEMFATLQASNANLLEITGNLKTITRRLSDGEGTLGRLINDPAIADHLRSSIDHLRTAAANGETLVANLEDFSARLKQPDGLASQLATDTTVFNRIKGAVARLNQAAAEAGAFTSSLKEAGEGLNNKNSPAGTLLHDEDAGADLQRTLKNLRISSKELSDDLEAIQHNFLLRGFFRKREKEGKQ
ncbi:MlaD family protein [Puia sp.]|jgi:phospholipid/cholesterol/gamma-HCH transport system substrate-binding protein|uniref:MlaD family protein n=1 Tax=Puia sp. TaxID=2045100 RepID=UPI002F422723